VAKQDKEKRDQLAMKSLAKPGVEKNYIEALCDDTYKNLF
jgi:hypothetical protein